MTPSTSCVLKAFEPDPIRCNPPYTKPDNRMPNALIRLRPTDETVGGVACSHLQPLFCCLPSVPLKSSIFGKHLCKITPTYATTSDGSCLRDMSAISCVASKLSNIPNTILACHKSFSRRSEFGLKHSDFDTKTYQCCMNTLTYAILGCVLGSPLQAPLAGLVPWSRVFMPGS